jgi:hypothetical protein
LINSHSLSSRGETKTEANSLGVGWLLYSDSPSFRGEIVD